MPQYTAQPPLPWSIPRLSTKRLFGVAVTILAINDALHVVTRCLRPTPTDNLFILAGIKLTEIRGQKTILFLARCAQEPQHHLYERVLSPFGGQLRQLKSNHLFVPAAFELLIDPSQSSTSVV